jgi:hypothetical protein
VALVKAWIDNETTGTRASVTRARQVCVRQVFIFIVFNDITGEMKPIEVEGGMQKS